MTMGATVTPASLYTAIAACTFEIRVTESAIQLLPAGSFKARDGRPKEVAAWCIDGAIAARLIAQVAARSTDVVVDYEHQTISSVENGQPAPAAGWFHALEWREGVGLFATGVRWTDRAKAMINAGEYRYLSPVFSYDPKTGDVLDLHHVGLTNYPALDGMAALPALAAARFGLPSGKDQGNAQIEAVSDSEIVSLKQEVAALRAAQSATAVEQLVQSGLTAGRLLPAQEHWARELGHSSLAALKGYLEKTPVIPTLARCQAHERQDTPTNVDELPPEALAACRGLGISPEDYLATLNS